jgi:hypothetical protein
MLARALIINRISLISSLDYITPIVYFELGAYCSTHSTLAERGRARGASFVLPAMQTYNFLLPMT